MSDSQATGFSPADSGYMAHALRLARRGRYSAHPNPRVGCVLVKDDRVVGQGWHAHTGEAHAEVNAIQDAGIEARDSVAYLTLEPCSHRGRTPPCTDALKEAGVRSVVFAMQDPDPRVSGRGVSALKLAGIQVRGGLMESQAQHLNRGFVSRVTRGRPFVRLKMAASLDGATAMANGESQWITGKEARADVQRLRAESGAILTGIGTVLADDPSLTVRDASLTERQPMRVVIDSQLRMPPSACMLALAGDTAIYCADDSNRDRLAKMGAGVHCVAGADGWVDLRQVVDSLGQQQINDLLVEAGPTLAGALMSQRLVDELVIYQAPHIMGSETRRLFTTPGWIHLSDRADLTITDVRQIGGDTRITATP